MEYDGVLVEYLHLDHMEEVSPCEKIIKDKYYSFYLPTSCSSKTKQKATKVRVVFNASRSTSSRNSLNDILFTGPTLQPDLVLLILNFAFIQIRIQRKRRKNVQTNSRT